MDYGANLPLKSYDGRPYSLEHLLAYTETAERLGFQALVTNDVMVSSGPWLDGMITLAAVLARTGRMELITSVALPVVRGPIPFAKTLGAIDILSGGRLIVGVGEGRAPRDYAGVGIPYEERRQRLNEAIQALRALWRRDGVPFKGRFYSTEGITLEPHPTQQSGPPIWIGSWGTEVGLRRVARLGDGWLASAHTATPEVFAGALVRLREHLIHYGKDPDRFPNTLSTVFMYVTEDRRKAEGIIQETLSPTMRHSEGDMRQRILVGPAQECAEKLVAWRDAGVQRILLWPVADEVQQLEIFQERVAPLVQS